MSDSCIEEQERWWQQNFVPLRCKTKMKIILIPDESSGRSSTSLSARQVRRATMILGAVVGLSLTGAVLSAGVAWHKSKQLDERLEMALALPAADADADYANTAPAAGAAPGGSALALTTGDTTQNVADGTSKAESRPASRAEHEAEVAAREAEQLTRTRVREALNNDVETRNQSVKGLMQAAENAPEPEDLDADRVFIVAQAISQMRGQLRNYQKVITDVRGENEARLSVVGSRMGQLQAHLMRLNALGSRLTSIAQLADGEFDFQAEPALGGVESEDNIPTGVTVMGSALDDLEESIKRHSQQLDVLEALIRDRELEKESYPAIWPADGGWISSGYGKRRDPFSGRRAMHRGIDIAGRSGSYITSAAAGVVTHAGKTGGYGLLVEINHGNGYVTRYGHCQEIVVKVGDKVEKGGAIAKMGSTGRSTGTHLHFEVLLDGKHRDPRKFLQGAG